MSSGGYVIPFEAKLKCGICKELITDARSLSCGHTFCKDCLKRSTSPGGTLSCSNCTEKSQLPRGGVEQLPRCFVINGLLDAIQETFGQGGNAEEVSIGKHGFQLEKNFSCAICWNLMTDPRYLPCGHSFCVECLMGLHQTQDTPGIECSHCKVEHRLPAEGVNGLPVGHRINSIATEIKSNKGQPSEPPAKQPTRSNQTGHRRPTKKDDIADEKKRAQAQTDRRRQTRKDDIADEKRKAQDEYQILLRQLSGKTVTLDIDRNASISDLEEKVRTRTRMEPEHFSLTHNGRTCERSRSLSYYNISNHDTVNMITRMVGGRAGG